MNNEQELATAMGPMYHNWRANLALAIGRYRGKYSFKIVTGVKVHNGKYLHLHWQPEVGGKYEDRGHASIGSVGDPVAETIAAAASQCIGTAPTRVLDYLDQNGYKAIAWAGPLPQDMEGLVVEVEEGSVEDWSPMQQPAPMPAPVQQGQMQPMPQPGEPQQLAQPLVQPAPQPPQQFGYPQA